jgi:hypothetical protein
MSLLISTNRLALGCESFAQAMSDELLCFGLWAMSWMLGLRVQTLVYWAMGYELDAQI